MKSTTQRIVFTALLTALVCVATMIIKIPLPSKGYINIGDAVVLLSGWLLSPLYGFLAAGIGSALADIFSGYIIYAPATFVIKGIMSLLSCILFKKVFLNSKKVFSRIISGLIAEIVMVGGYFLFEGLLYGFMTAAANIPANAIQGTAGIILGLLLVEVFEKSRIEF
ncbi:MAG: ECF transporter S component [Ruminococcaceae bacterium]|nr:ECF transporter S component [Oscillospiraceae bacterium]